MTTKVYTDDKLDQCESNSLCSLEEVDSSYGTNASSNGLMSGRDADVSTKNDSILSTLCSGKDTSSANVVSINFIQEGCGTPEGCGGCALLNVRSYLATFIGYALGIERHCAFCLQPLELNKTGLVRNAYNDKLVFIHLDCYEAIPASSTTIESSSEKNKSSGDVTELSNDLQKKSVSWRDVIVHPRREPKNDESPMTPKRKTSVKRKNLTASSKISRKSSVKSNRANDIGTYFWLPRRQRKKTNDTAVSPTKKKSAKASKDMSEQMAKSEETKPSLSVKQKCTYNDREKKRATVKIKIQGCTRKKKKNHQYDLKEVQTGNMNKKK